MAFGLSSFCDSQAQYLPQGMWDLSSLTRDQSIRRWILNHWTTRKFKETELVKAEVEGVDIYIGCGAGSKTKVKSAKNNRY